MVPTFSDLDAGLYIVLFLLIFFACILVFKKYLWNILDPLIMLLLNLAFNVVILLYSFLKKDLSPYFFYYCLAAFMSFIVGFKLSTRLVKKMAPAQKSIFKGPNKFITVTSILFALFLMTVSNLYTLSQIGLGVITGAVNPDNVKVTLTQGGSGIFQKVGLASQVLLVPLLAHAFYFFKLKRLVFVSFSYYFISSIFFNFSKSGLFFMLFNLGIVMYYYKTYLNYQIINVKKIAILGSLGLISALVVLLNLSSTYGLNISSLLLDRFVASGGGTYQYFVLTGRNAIDHMSFLQKFQSYFDVFLSTFKFKDWEPLSYVAQMTEYLTGVSLPGFGANPYMFLDGYFLFKLGGIIYCGFLGCLIAICRGINWGYLNFFIINYLVLFLPSDPGTGQHQLIAIMFFGPVFLFIKLLSDMLGKTTTVRVENNIGYNG